MTDEFRTTVEYVRARIAPSAVFHVMTFDRSFRAYAGRAMLPVSDEWLIPIYDGAPVSRLRKESLELWSARNDLQESRELARRFGADYLLTCGHSGEMAARPLFEHAPYAIYALR